LKGEWWMKKEKKTAAIPLRLKPSVKKALVKLAEKEMRSINQMVEVIIVEYIKRQNDK